MRPFEFMVSDEGGLWGSLRVVGEGVEDALRVAREHLQANEVEPNGSLKMVFKLTEIVE